MIKALTSSNSRVCGSWRRSYQLSSAEGVILPGHYSALLTDAAAAKAARRLVAARHGRAGAALLRPGERALTAQRITDHGRSARSPASLAARAAAKATLGAALADRARGPLAVLVTAREWTWRCSVGRDPRLT
jgi:hypothetical protein